ncbi:MAG: guanylate kinase [Pseudomonadota bacterium]|nr:guanylate kinase [Pseudomonadota bacterium]
MSKLIVVSAPSGGGKTSLIKALFEDFNEVNILLGISFTTRKPRSKEKNGQSYYFISKEEFQKKIDEGDFLESAEVFGNYYGTSKEWVSDKLSKGYDVMLELDWQGALQVKKSYPEAITVFVLPPSIKELEVRLRNRRQDSKETISKRISFAKEEIQKSNKFDVLILNNSFKDALNDLKQVVTEQDIAEERQEEALRVASKLLEDAPI